MIVDALNRIGCAEVAQITVRAIGALAIKGAITVEGIDRVMSLEDNARSGRLNELDQFYFQIAGDLSVPLFEFIKSNKAKVVQFSPISGAISRL